MRKWIFAPVFMLALGACSTAPGSGEGGGAGIAQFNTAGTFEGSSYELSALGWEVTQPAPPAWVGLINADDPAAGKNPGAGAKVMKLGFWDATQHPTRGFAMQRKLAVAEAGTYTFRFKYKGEKFSGAVKVAFDTNEKTIPTEDWKGGDDKWEWNSADGKGNYENFAADAASTADFTLEAKTYTVKFSITGAYAAGEWGYIDGLEIIKK